MKKIKILAIAPYDGLAESIHKISKDFEDIETTVFIGNLQMGLNIAKEKAKENYDLILSRGGTAELIREHLNIPVIDISISVYDILRAIKIAEQYGKPFAIVGFSPITTCAKMLCDLLQYEIDIVTFEKEDDVVPTLENLVKDHCELVICDLIGSTTARHLGMNSILISSGQESIENAFNEAIQLFNSLNYVYKQKSIFQTILTDNDDDFMIYDSHGNLWFSSVTNSPIQNKILNLVHTYLPSLLSIPGKLIEKTIDQYLITISSKHCFYEDEKYSAVIISTKESLLFYEDLISIHNAFDANSDQLTTDFSSSNFIGIIGEQITTYAQSHYPILIAGEDGTGKDKAAQLIYEKGPYVKKPLYTIDCSNINEKQWKQLITNEASPLNHIYVTLYFKKINRLSPENFRQLRDFMTNSQLSKQNRLIFSAVIKNHSTEQEHITLNYIKNKLSSLTLQLPPLRERIDDLPSIIALYINQLNASLGKQIIGLTTAAMKLIQAFEWPHNLDQLQRILKELVLLTGSSYISEETTETILKKELELMPMANNAPILQGLDLNQPLDEINYQIIQLILQMEHGSKEKTAKRLGIGRSTLWRILKNH